MYYSKVSRDRLKRMLGSHGIEVSPISGRAPNATETLRKYPANLVIVDRDVADISVTQAVRQIVQILPQSLIFTATAKDQTADVYRNGRRIGSVTFGEFLLFVADEPVEVRASRYGFPTL